jgi:hypothetical protein
MHSSDCDIRTPCTIRYNLTLHIVVFIHFIISSVAAAAPPKSYYEYDSQKQINASEARISNTLLLDLIDTLIMLLRVAPSSQLQQLFPLYLEG